MMMRLSQLVVSLTLLVGCSHDLAELRANPPIQMKEFAVPSGDLSTCTKQRFNKASPATLSLLENSSAGVTRLAILKGGHDALFEFAFVSQNSQITLIEFRSLDPRDTRSDLVWKAIDECFRDIRKLSAVDARTLPVPTAERSIAP